MYEKILEWLYLNDGKYPNRNKWREEFLAFVKETEKNLDKNIEVLLNAVFEELKKPIGNKSKFTNTWGKKPMRTKEDLMKVYKFKTGKNKGLFRLEELRSQVGNMYRDLWSGEVIIFSEEIEKELERFI